jgi:signal transduction histidine kinase
MDEGSKKLKVFLLEDNPDDAELELYHLKKAGYIVEYAAARNRKEFLEKLPGFDADIILADYSLPDITGIEAIDICREMKKNVPVILITGDGNEMIAVDSLRLGAIDYILKKNITGLSARVSRALEIWNDRKAKERAEAEERRLQQSLFETQKMEAIGRLVNGIAHDFNNLLTGIMGFSELCIDDIPEGSKILDKLQSITALSQRGADLVRQLFIFSKQMPLELKIVDFNFFIIETMKFLKRLVEETVEINFDSQGENFKVKCDTAQFTQVLMNIILNSRDAMNGKGMITIKTGKSLLPSDLLTVQPKNNNSEFVCLSLSDTGVGIDKEDIQKIFEPFFTTKELGRGTGLGLSVVYSIVKAHDGFIKVFSEKGAGTTFKVYLPLVQSGRQGGETKFVKTPLEKDTKKLFGKETVLIAEDEIVLRDLIATVLNASGYKVLVASDGKEALDIFKAEQEKINLVISDMLMPNLDGLDLFKKLKLINPEVRFILMTGYSLTGQDEKMLRKMNAIIKKPFTPSEILKLIREILS